MLWITWQKGNNFPILSFLVDGNLTTAIADAVVGIVDAAELPRCNALYGFVAMDVVALVVQCDSAWHEVVHMADFERDGDFLVDSG